MASEERNALAELAERLNFDVDELNGKHKDHLGIYQCVVDDVIRAQRIIAELAKVPDCTFKGNPRVDKSADAVIACRAIAEEGTNDELDS